MCPANFCEKDEAQVVLFIKCSTIMELEILRSLCKFSYCSLWISAGTHWSILASSLWLVLPIAVGFKCYTLVSLDHEYNMWHIFPNMRTHMAEKKVNILFLCIVYALLTLRFKNLKCVFYTLIVTVYIHS